MAVSTISKERLVFYEDVTVIPNQNGNAQIYDFADRIPISAHVKNSDYSDIICIPVKTRVGTIWMKLLTWSFAPYTQTTVVRYYYFKR